MTAFETHVQLCGLCYTAKYGSVFGMLCGTGAKLQAAEMFDMGVKIVEEVELIVLVITPLSLEQRIDHMLRSEPIDPRDLIRILGL